MVQRLFHFQTIYMSLFHIKINVIFLLSLKAVKNLNIKYLTAAIKMRYSTPHYRVRPRIGQRVRRVNAERSLRGKHMHTNKTKSHILKNSLRCPSHTHIFFNLINATIPSQIQAAPVLATDQLPSVSFQSEEFYKPRVKNLSLPQLVLI